MNDLAEYTSDAQLLDGISRPSSPSMDSPGVSQYEDSVILSTTESQSTGFFLTSGGGIENEDTNVANSPSLLPPMSLLSPSRPGTTTGMIVNSPPASKQLQFRPTLSLTESISSSLGSFDEFPSANINARIIPPITPGTTTSLGSGSLSFEETK